MGEIDYEIDDVEYVILNNSAYSLVVSGGILTINTTDDGLHTNSGDLLISGGNITITTSDDAVAADKNLKITGGILNVLKSYEGIEAETIEIAGGENRVKASDDGINASSDESTTIQRQKCYIWITGGKTFVNASWDGVDSNGGMLVSGGELYVYGPTSGGDGSLDADTGIVITGGVLIAVGSSGMVETPANNSTQYVMSINLTSAVNGEILVKQGATILTEFDPISVFNETKGYQSLVISLPSLQKNTTYTVL